MSFGEILSLESSLGELAGMALIELLEKQTLAMPILELVVLLLLTLGVRVVKKH